MPTQEVMVRSATTEDLPNIKHCAKLAYQKYIERMQREPAPMHADFAKLIDRNAVAVATSGHKFAGFVVFYKRDNHTHLENVAVQPELAGQGIGRILITHVEQQAIKHGITRIELYTNEVMHENFGLYKHLGYTETDRREEDGFNRVFYSKKL